MGDQEWNEVWDLAYVGGMGCITTITELPKKRKKKVWKRPIGFMTDIDTLIEATDD